MANLSPLRPYMLFTDKLGNLTKEAYDFLLGLFNRVGGSLDSLNAATLQTHTWEAPGTLGSTTPNSAKVTTLTVTTSANITSPSLVNPVLTGGVANNASGYKHLRYILPSSLAANSTSSYTVAWTTAFADTNYTPTVSVVSTGLQVVRIDSYTASQVVVIVTNPTSTALGGTICVVGVHD